MIDLVLPHPYLLFLGDVTAAPFAKTAAIMIFSVAPTLGNSNATRAPLSFGAEAIT